MGVWCMVIHSGPIGKDHGALERVPAIVIQNVLSAVFRQFLAVLRFCLMIMVRIGRNVIRVGNKAALWTDDVCAGTAAANFPAILCGGVPGEPLIPVS